MTDIWNRWRTVASAPTVDLSTMDPDISAIEDTAEIIVADIREYDPSAFHMQLTAACITEPARMAQVIMALAAWVKPGESKGVRDARVEAITRAKAS